MKRKKSICCCCSRWVGGRFNKLGYCAKNDFSLGDESVPEDCILKLEYIVLEQKK